MRFFSVLLLLTILPFSATAAQEFSANRGPQFDARGGVGSFDIVAYVDGEALLYVQDTRIRPQMLSGDPVQNAGSNFTQPVPRAVFGNFDMEKIAGRGSVALVEIPTPKNNFTAVLRVKDDKPGRDLYHVRLSWSWNPADPTRLPYTGLGDRYGRPDDRNARNDRYDDRNDNRNREGVFEFKGRVDGVTVLHIHADQLRVENLSGQPLREQAFRFSGPLPNSTLREVALAEVSGRGRVELVEMPWEGNRFTAVVRITDSSPGSGQYGFKLNWRR